MEGADFQMTIAIAIVIGIAVILAIGFFVLELDVRGSRHARYAVPIFLSAVVIAVLVGINRGLRSFTDMFSTEALAGFLVGCAFCVGLYYLIIWIDPASRPRGPDAGADEKRLRDRF